MASRESYLKDLMGHVLQVLYMLFLGIIIAVFCGLGIDTFYTAPKAPEFPAVLQQEEYETAPISTRYEQKAYDAAQKKYMEDMKPYNRNASIIAIVLAVIALSLSLTVLLRWEVIANGVLLGGVFTLAYSIILGMQTDDTKFRFFLAAVGVLITLVLGYIKFIRPNEEKS